MIKRGLELPLRGESSSQAFLFAWITSTSLPLLLDYPLQVAISKLGNDGELPANSHLYNVFIERSQAVLSRADPHRRAFTRPADSASSVGHLKRRTTSTRTECTLPHDDHTCWTTHDLSIGESPRKSVVIAHTLRSNRRYCEFLQTQKAKPANWKCDNFKPVGQASVR